MIEPAPVYLGLRETFLATKRENLPGLDPSVSVYAAVFEAVANGIVVSTAASATGDASFYSSNGGGGIGGIKVPEIRELAKTFVTLAAELENETVSHADLPALPAADQVVLILLTDTGLRVLRLNTATMTTRDSAISRVAAAAGAIVQALLRARSHKIDPPQS